MYEQRTIKERLVLGKRNWVKVLDICNNKYFLFKSQICHYFQRIRPVTIMILVDINGRIKEQFMMKIMGFITHWLKVITFWT